MRVLVTCYKLCMSQSIRQQSLATLAVIATLCVSMSSCSASREGVPVDVESTGTAVGKSPSVPVSSAPSLTVPIDVVTPFSEYGPAVNAVLNGGTVDEVGRKARWEAVQASVADCMQGEGFKYDVLAYVQTEAAQVAWVQNSLNLPALPNDRVTVEQVGYGRHDIDADEASRLSGQEVDANSAYLVGLSEQAQMEYLYALGGQRGPDDAHPDASGGCVGRAEAAVKPLNGISESAVAQFTPLIQAMRGVVATGLGKDARTIKLDEKWTSCMLGAGFDVEPPVETSRGTVLVGPLNAFSLAVVTTPDGVPHWPNGQVAEEVPVEERFLVGSAAERAIAVADYDCRAESDYVATLTEILLSVEREFVGAHAAELEAMTAAVSIR